MRSIVIVFILSFSTFSYAKPPEANSRARDKGTLFQIYVFKLRVEELRAREREQLAHPDTRGKYISDTFLEAILKSKNMFYIADLMQAGADMNDAEQASTAWKTATDSGRVKVIQLLLNAGVGFDERMVATVLRQLDHPMPDWGWLKARYKMVLLFLMHGARIDSLWRDNEIFFLKGIITKFVSNELERAVLQNDCDEVAWLLGIGTPIGKALAYAVGQNRPELVELLLQYATTENIRDALVVAQAILLREKEAESMRNFETMLLARTPQRLARSIGAIALSTTSGEWLHPTIRYFDDEVREMERLAKIRLALDAYPKATKPKVDAPSNRNQAAKIIGLPALGWLAWYQVKSVYDWWNSPRGKPVRAK